MTRPPSEPQATETYLARACALGVPEEQARATLDDVVAEARDCWMPVDVHAVALRRLAASDRPDPELRDAARRHLTALHGGLGAPHPEWVDQVARVLAALAPHAARTMARVRDTIAATDVECAELESAAERARDAFHARPGPRRTDSRPAWQSPYGPPHRR